jgi:hypothetical protein
MFIKFVHRWHLVFCFLQFEYTGLLQNTIAAAVGFLLDLSEELNLYSLN